MSESGQGDIPIPRQSIAELLSGGSEVGPDGSDAEAPQPPSLEEKIGAVVDNVTVDVNHLRMGVVGTVRGFAETTVRQLGWVEQAITEIRETTETRPTGAAEAISAPMSALNRFAEYYGPTRETVRTARDVIAQTAESDSVHMQHAAVEARPGTPTVDQQAEMTCQDVAVSLERVANILTAESSPFNREAPDVTETIARLEGWLSTLSNGGGPTAMKGVTRALNDLESHVKTLHGSMPSVAEECEEVDAHLHAASSNLQGLQEHLGR